MHVHQSIELATLISTGGQVLACASGDLSQEGMREYWSASVSRLKSWCRSLERHATRIKRLRGQQARRIWESTKPVMEEILVSEMLVRVWSTAVCDFEKLRTVGDATLAVRKILAGHLQVRHRALCLMVHGQGLKIEDAVNLNRLRRQNEYWTDFLLGNMAGSSSAEEFSFSRGRLREFVQLESRRPYLGLGQHCLLASMRTSYQCGLAPSSPCGELNSAITAAILSCFPADLFDSTGRLKSFRMAGLARPAGDRHGHLEQLLPTCKRHSTSTPLSSRLVDFPRHGSGD